MEPAEGFETAAEPQRKRPRTETAHGTHGSPMAAAEATPAPPRPHEPLPETALGPRAKHAPAKWSPDLAVPKRRRRKASSGPTPAPSLPALGPRGRRNPLRWSSAAFDRRGRWLSGAPGAAGGGAASEAPPGSAGAGDAGLARSPDSNPCSVPGSGLGSSARRRAAAVRECTPFSPSMSVTEDLHGRHLADTTGPSPGQGSKQRPADGLSAEAPGLPAQRAAGNATGVDAAAEQVLEPAGGGTMVEPAQQGADPGPVAAGPISSQVWEPEPAAAAAPGAGLDASSTEGLAAQQSGGAASGGTVDKSRDPSGVGPMAVAAPDPQTHAPRGGSQRVRPDPDPSPAPGPSPGRGACSAGHGNHGGLSAAAVVVTPAEGLPTAGEQAGPASEQLASRAAPLPHAGDTAASAVAEHFHSPEAAPDAAADADMQPHPGQGADPGACCAAADGPPAGQARSDAGWGASFPWDPAISEGSPTAERSGSPLTVSCMAAASGAPAASAECPEEGSVPAVTGQSLPTSVSALSDACGVDEVQGIESCNPPTDTALFTLLSPRQPARSADRGQGSGSVGPVMDAVHFAAANHEEHGRSVQRIVRMSPPLADDDAWPAPGPGSPGLGSAGGAAPGAAAQGSVVLHADVPSLLPALYDSDASPEPSPQCTPRPRQRPHAGREAGSVSGTQVGAACRQARQEPAADRVDEEPSACSDPSPAQHNSGAAVLSPGHRRAAAAWCDAAPAVANASPPSAPWQLPAASPAAATATHASAPAPAFAGGAPSAGLQGVSAGPDPEDAMQALPRCAHSGLATYGPPGGGMGPGYGAAELEPGAEPGLDALSPQPEELPDCDWGDGGAWSPQREAALQARALSALLCVC